MNKAKRGQWVVYRCKGYVAQCKLPDNHESKNVHTKGGLVYTEMWRLGQVTNITREGIVKKYRPFPSSQSTYSAPIGCQLLPEMETAIEEFWGNVSWLTLGDVRATLKPFVKNMN